jgi:Flp pilus assembly protein TadG
MHRVTRALRRRRDQRGASAVEFALVMLPLIYLVFGIIQYGLYFWAMQAGTSATSDAVRRLTVGDCHSTTELKQFLHNRLGGSSPTPVSGITTTEVYKEADGSADTSPGTVGGSVSLTITYDSINMNFPFIPLPGDGEVTRTVFGRVEDTTGITGGCA